MNLSEMQSAIREAEETLQNADKIRRQVANLIRGHLRSSGVTTYVLAELKAELRDFNMHTGKWKERK